ncbi:hypothetical protein M1141_00435 [Candidatus Marsarchaeota archaeon]|nr:hypothetical protein [Candidatus Marsarchaeota archaeon]
MKQQSKRSVPNFFNAGLGKTAENRNVSKNTDGLFNGMKHNLGAISFIAIILVFIALVIVFSSMSRQNASQFSRCSNIILKSYRTSCFASAAASMKNISMCNYAGNKSACIENIAEASNNSAYCSALENASAQNACIFSISIKTKNSALCSSISGPSRSRCLFYFAKSQNFMTVHLSECNSMANNSEMRICTDLFYYEAMISSQNSSFCRRLPAEQNLTIMSYMLNASAPPNSKNNSGLSAISKNASLTGNASKINSSIFNSLQPVINRESNLIELISENITPQNLCYYESALYLHNASYCRLAGNLSLQCGSAFENLTRSKVYNSTNFTDMINKCNNLPYSNLTLLCRIGLYSQYAVMKKNVSYCLESGNQSIENICISNMAGQLNNSYYCSYLKNSTLRFDCEAPFNLSMTR